ncbi:uncharacterized protein LOC124175951 [Neodiprion fabricii]|uniref:uncharacterized protein LOC124175951 n=1 Tax=Neodiprion fabricii TaxID=2872261 RepID=UPI001ED9672A|nr:uncharacterized protein LOC124175951 [Neodiprion fabricii]
MPCPENYKPSQALLRLSLRSRGQEYPRVAALHGIAYVADPTRPRAERIAWCVCVLISSAAALGIIVTLMDRFQTDPMLESLDVRLDGAPIPLPKIYVCPPWESFEENGANKKPGNDVYGRLYKWDLSRPLHGVNFTNSDESARAREFFVQHSPKCESFIRNFSVNGIQFNCSSFESFFGSAGKCFTVPSVDIVIDTVEINFTFSPRFYPTRIYVALREDPDVLMHLPFHIFLFPSTVTVDLQETYTSPEARVLARFQRKCYFPGEQPPVVKCVLDCQVANSLEHCDCVPWYLARVGVKECPINRYECLSSKSAEILDVSRCLCRLSCANIAFKKVQFDMKSASENCDMKIMARSKVKFRRTVRFGWIDLLVSFGGIAGLFLGSSLLSGVEFGYYFSLRTYCGAVLTAPKRRHNITKIKVIDGVWSVSYPTGTRKRLVLPRDETTTYDYVN